MVGGGGGVLPVCGEVAGPPAGSASLPRPESRRRCSRPAAAAWSASRKGLFANSVLGRLADGLTTQLIQFGVVSGLRPGSLHIALTCRSDPG